MSYILTLSEDRLEEIVPLLAKYESEIEAAAPIFQIEGKRLELVARDLPHYQSRYDQFHQELKALEEWLQLHRDRVQARLWKKYVEGYPRQLSTKDIQAYIAGEKDYLNYAQLLIEVVHTKNKLASIVEALQQLGWMVGHMTKLRVAEMQDAIL